MSKPPSLAPEDTRILQRIPLEIFLLSLIGAIITTFLFKVMTGLFVLAGGILAAASFFWLKSSLSRLLIHPNKSKVLRSVLGSYLLRLLLIIAVFSIIIIFFLEKIIAFMAGFSIIILVFLVEAIRTLPRIKKWKS
ncbi:MAG: hypothetical protein GTO17_09920 [Candidatus Aminicenantes bacterium]|nr:hypothetical protein [Candidatus Aminicenantes bacterium]